MDVVADDEPLDQLDTGGRRQVAHLEPSVAVAGERALTGSHGRDHEGAESAGGGTGGGEALGHLDGVVGADGAADDRDAHATPLVVEEEGDRLGDRWTLDGDGDDGERRFGAIDGIDPQRAEAGGLSRTA